MAEVALLANTAATAVVLAALIVLLGPVSGAHFNPAVTVIEALRGLARRDARFVGAFASLVVARALFPLEKPTGVASATESAVEHAVSEKAEALEV
jgi:Major intrinsic protein